MNSIKGSKEQLGIINWRKPLQLPYFLVYLCVVSTLFTVSVNKNNLSTVFVWNGLTCACLVLWLSKLALYITFIYFFFFTSQLIKLVDLVWSQKMFRQGKILIKSTLHENNCLFAICSRHWSLACLCLAFVMHV